MYCYMLGVALLCVVCNGRAMSMSSLEIDLALFKGLGITRSSVLTLTIFKAVDCFPFKYSLST